MKNRRPSSRSQGSVDSAAGVTGFFSFPLALITNGGKLISVSDVKTIGNDYILCPLPNLLQRIKISIAIERLHISDRGGDTDPFSVADEGFGPFPMYCSVLVFRCRHEYMGSVVQIHWAIPPHIMLIERCHLSLFSFDEL